MNGQENAPTSSLLCANGCGFYGSPTTKNLCSKCYRESLMMEHNQMKPAQQQPLESAPSLRATSADTSIGSNHNSPLEPSCIHQQDSEMATISDPAVEYGTFLHHPSESSIPDDPMMFPPGNAGEAPILEHHHQEQLLPPASFSSSDTHLAVTDGDLSLAASSQHQESILLSTVPDGLTNSAAEAPQHLAPPSTASHVALTSSFVSTDPHSDSRTSTTVCLNEPMAPSVLGDASSSGLFPEQTNRGRCFQCNKKVGLLGFTCRCGYNFCGNHRYADQHRCQFDYKELARQQLSKANQKVVADKLNRI